MACSNVYKHAHQPQGLELGPKAVESPQGCQNDYTTTASLQRLDRWWVVGTEHSKRALASG